MELSSHDARQLSNLDGAVPPGTAIHLTHLSSDTTAARTQTVRRVREAGFLPVPHLAARRIASHHELDQLLSQLHEAGADERILIVAGDPREPAGPFRDTLDLIASGALAAHGFRHVSIAGHPGGHPGIDEQRLWDAVARKTELLTERGHSTSIITQFSFDATTVCHWIRRARAVAPSTVVRVGVPGPTQIARLLRYARRFGVASSVRIAQRYGLSLVNVLDSAGPDRFLEQLANDAAGTYGGVLVHLYTLGDLQATGGWLRERRARP